jgi:hypothetical protein
MKMNYSHLDQKKRTLIYWWDGTGWWGDRTCWKCYHAPTTSQVIVPIYSSRVVENNRGRESCIRIFSQEAPL